MHCLRRRSLLADVAVHRVHPTLYCDGDFFTNIELVRRVEDVASVYFAPPIELLTDHAAVLVRSSCLGGRADMDVPAPVTCRERDWGTVWERRVTGVLHWSVSMARCASASRSLAFDRIDTVADTGMRIGHYLQLFMPHRPCRPQNRTHRISSLALTVTANHALGMSLAHVNTIACSDHILSRCSVGVNDRHACLTNVHLEPETYCRVSIGPVSTRCGRGPVMSPSITPLVKRDSKSGESLW